jgi:hypothetical protein
VKEGQTSKSRPVFVNGKLCGGMAAGARHATEELGRTVFLWEIQRVLEGKKTITGLEVIRADEPLTRKVKKPVQPRTYTAEARRRMSEAGRKGKDFWRGKRMNDLFLLRLGQAKVGKKNPAVKLTENDVLDIQIALEEGDKLFTLSCRFGVSEMQISRIKNGKCWKYLKDDYMPA